MLLDGGTLVTSRRRSCTTAIGATTTRCGGQLLGYGRGPDRLLHECWRTTRVARSELLRLGPPGVTRRVLPAQAGGSVDRDGLPAGPAQGTARGYAPGAVHVRRRRLQRDVWRHPAGDELSDARTATVAVLVYHSVAATTTRSFARLTIDPDSVRRAPRGVRELAVRVIRFGEVPDAWPRGRRCGRDLHRRRSRRCGVGRRPRRSRATGCRPRFRAERLRGWALRWLTGKDGERPTLGWAELSELARAGFEIGSHGRLHLAADVNSAEVVRRDARTAGLTSRTTSARRCAASRTPSATTQRTPGRRSARQASRRPAWWASSPLAPTTTGGHSRACS